MGLSIRTEHTDEHISWGYSVIHMVRTLAYIACKVPKDIAILRMRYLITSDDIKVNYTGENFNQMSATGFLFPNLLWHSDCDGTYTARGKVAFGAMLTGNIYKLHEELEMLISEDFRNNKEYKMQEIPESWIESLEKFYALVSEEIKHKRPKIMFS